MLTPKKQQKSCVGHEATIPPLTNISQIESCEKKEKDRSSVACEPLQNTSEFKTQLSTIIQALMSQLPKISLNVPPFSFSPETSFGQNLG